MKNLFILSTPAHYFNLLQYIEQFDVKTEESDLLFLSSFSTSDKIMDNFIDQYIDIDNWKSVRRISLWDTMSKKIYSSSNLKKITIFFIKVIGLYSLRKYNHLIVSQVDQFYCKVFYFLVSFKKVIALDEGNAVFEIIHNRNNKNLFMPKKITFFSSYDINVQQPDTLVKCEYLFSKKILKDTTINKNEICFIGSPYLEDGLIEKNLYHSYVSKIADDYRGKTIKYFPHRREKDKNLRILKENYKFSIIQIDLPIELYFLEKKMSPEIILGFTTAALLNLKKITNNETQIYSYYINSKHLKSFSNELIKIKKQYEECGIKMIDL